MINKILDNQSSNKCLFVNYWDTPHERLSFIMAKDKKGKEKKRKRNYVLGCPEKLEVCHNHYYILHSTEFNEVSFCGSIF